MKNNNSTIEFTIGEFERSLVGWEDREAAAKAQHLQGHQMGVPAHKGHTFG